jgi:hypothetical protein
MVDPSRARVVGPLAPYAHGFCVELAGRGWAPSSAPDQMKLMACLSRWMEAEHAAVWEGAARGAGRAVRAVASRDGRRVVVGVDVTMVSDPAVSLDDVISDADSAMYRAKELGGERYELAGPRRASRPGAPGRRA